MKRILLFAAIALLALAASCKKDDKTDDPTPEDLIVGRWKASKAFIGQTDVLVPSASLKTELEVEFKTNDSLAFNWTNTVLTTNPPSVSEFTLKGVYTVNGENLTITVTSGNDSKTVSGPLDISASHLLFDAISGDTATFVNLLEADKL